jgi:fucose permease
LNLVLGAILQLLAQGLRVWAPPFPLFSVSFFFAGVGLAYQDSHSNTFVSKMQGAHRWLGLIHAMYGGGLLVSPFVATPVASAYVPSIWYLFYYFPFGIGVINLTLVLFAFRDVLALRHAPSRQASSQAHSSGASPQRRTATSDAKATLRLRSVWMLSIFYFFYIGAVLTASGWVVEYLVKVRGGALGAMGYVPAGISGGIFIGRLVLAEPTHRFGERRMVLYYSMAALALQLVFWLVPNTIAAAVAVSCMSFFMAPFFASGVSVGSKLFPHELQSAALGLVFVMGQAGGALFPSLTGLIATRAGVQTLQPILVGLLVLMGLSWCLIPKAPKHSE